MTKTSLPVFLSALIASSTYAGLVDGSFEGLDAWGYSFFQGGIDTPWNTTAPDNLIEGWSDGFMGVSAYNGTKFVELNANYASALYQEVAPISAGTQVNWHFAHRGRYGLDTMKLTITDLGLNQVYGGGDDSVLFDQEFTDGTATWGVYYGSVIVAGNKVRFSFEAVNAVGGNTQGNFIDWCDFGTEVVIPAPGAVALLGMACLIGNRRRR